MRECCFLLVGALLLGSSAASDADWESAVQTLTSSTFDDFAEEKTPALVMFYAPWCGHCKAFKPTFGKAAAAVAEHKLNFGMGGVDCTDDAGKSLCAADKYNVTGFPTTFYFAAKGAEPVNYDGARTTKGVKSFIKGKLGLERFPGNEKFVNEPKWEENGNVVHQTEDHFEEFRKENAKMFVMFYAPWCGHCKKFKPVFAEASRKIKAASLVAVDCTEEAAVCENYGAKAYPTLTWFGKSEGEGERYDGSREDANDLRSWIETKVETEARKAIGSTKLEAKDLRKLRVRVLRKMLKERGLECKGCTDKKEFVKMVLDNQGVKVKAAKKHKMTWAEEKRAKKARDVAEAGWGEGTADVEHLTDQTFDEFRAKQDGKPAIVMFYAPWCGHCKAMKPKYAEAATVVKSEGSMAAIDCDTNPTVCGKFKVTGFPSLKFFADGEASARSVDGREAHEFVKQFNPALAKPLQARAKRIESACKDAGLCVPS